jgi:hypothetical protein
MEYRKISCPCRKKKPAAQPVSIPTELCHRLGVFENKMLRRTFKFVEEHLTEDWRKLIICAIHQVISNEERWYG